MSTQPQRIRSGLRPLPFRGDLIAAGAIPLAVGVALADLRMDGTWADGVRAAVVAIAAALLLALAWRAPVEGRNPRAYVSRRSRCARWRCSRWRRRWAARSGRRAR
jgi:hypothetical protein